MFAKLLAHCAFTVSRFCRARRAATAVEFALIAPAFIATLVAVLQVCIFVFAQMAIQNAATQAGRYFLTGQAQNNKWTAATIVSKVCPSAIFNCANMFVTVQTAASFAAANTGAPAMYSGNTKLTQADYTYDTGAAGDIMVVQLVYAWTVVALPLGFNFFNLPNNQAQLTGTSAFRVEPYSGN